MVDLTPYFGYQVPQSSLVFIGSPTEIINTLQYYKERDANVPDAIKIEIPPKDSLLQLSEINITCCFPLAVKDHMFDATIEDRVTLQVNANAFDYVRSISQRHDQLKRADLYKFTAGAPIFGIFLLPEGIMHNMQTYNWAQHEKQVHEWKEIRKHELNDAQARRYLLRV